MRKKFKWTVEFTVDRSWIENGFDLTEERAFDMLRETLPHAFADELSTKIISAPDSQEIKKAQGY